MSYELTDTGKIRTRRAHITFLNNLQFSLTLYAKVHNIDYTIDRNSHGWQQLKLAVKVRDRLMHPKTASDLFVTDDEIRTAITAMAWFDSQIVLLLVKTVKQLRKLADNITQPKRQRTDE